MAEEVKEEVVEEEHPEEEKKRGIFGKVKAAIIPDADEQAVPERRGHATHPKTVQSGGPAVP